MALTTQPNAVSRVYAHSLYDLAHAQGGREGVERVCAELLELSDLTRTQRGFGELLTNPAITSAQRSASLTKILQGRVSDVTFRFVQVLCQKGRVHALPAIADSLDEIAQEKFGRVEVNVTTAQPLGDPERAALRDRLAQAMGKEVVMHAHVEPAMLGGVKIGIGDQLIDASVATRLRKMKDRLTKEGEAALRARIGKALEG